MTSTSSALATALPATNLSFMEPTPRRGFLSGLAALPLIGGSVSLLGRPKGVAEPVTPALLEAYKTWLEYERRWLTWEMAGDPVHQARYANFKGSDRVALSDAIDGCLMFIGDSGHYHGRSRRAAPSTRAALVLSAVDCSWEDRDGFLSAGSKDARA